MNIENTLIDKALKSSRFSMTINDDDGIISLEIIDYYSLTRTVIDGDELNNQKGMNIGSLSKLLIGLAKPAYRNIAETIS